MGEPHDPEKVKLICGVLAADEAALRAARDVLAARLGAIERVSEVWPFAHTVYYADEIGPTILRQFVSFAAAFERGRLAEIKLATNALERKLAADLHGQFPRPVNLDPGYIHLGQLVLATTKDRAHRIYLGGGIFAEVTLLYEKGGWRALPWTYADYTAPGYHGYFSEVRNDLKQQRHAE